MWKRFVQLLFILLAIIALLYFDEALCVRSEHGVDQARALYYQPRNTIDVMMMGTSHIHCDVDTSVLWTQYGIAAYDYSAAEQPLWITYYYLQELCKYQSPRVVVLDLYGPGRFKDDYQYKWLSENLCGVRFSPNKLRMLSVSAERDRFEDFFPSFATYHDRILSLTAEDFLFPFSAGAEFRAFKGFTPYLPGDSRSRPEVWSAEVGGLTEKSEHYLNKIIDDTQARGIALFLIVSPYTSVNQDESVYNQIGGIAAERGVDFIDFNYVYDEIGLDFDQDFYDESHLAYWGARKFTDYLAKKLLERYDLPDHRGEEGYESWDADAARIAAQVRENS